MAKKEPAPLPTESEARKLGGRYSISPADVVIIGLDTDDGPEHPLYDDRIHLALDERDVQDVIENSRNNGPGIISDVVVSSDKKYPGKRVVIDGRQRVRWLREVNRRLSNEGQEIKMLAVVNKGGDGDPRLLFGMQISANEHRVENDLIIRMNNLVRFLALQGDDPESPSSDSLDLAAVRFKVSVATCRNWLRLRKLVPAVLDMVRDGRLTMVQALPLTKLSGEKQIAGAKEIIASSGSSKSKNEKAKQIGDGGEGGSGEGDGEGGDSRSSKPAVKKPREALVAGVTGLAVEDIKLKAGAGTELHPEFIRALRWMLGDLPSESVRGMTDLVYRYTSGERAVRPLKPGAKKAAVDDDEDSDEE